MNGFVPEARAVLLASVEQAIRELEPWAQRMRWGWPWHCMDTAVIHLLLLAGIIRCAHRAA